MPPDIEMCSDSDCPSRVKCYRFAAKPSENQSYMDFDRRTWDDRCESYVESISKSQVRRLDAQTRKP